MTLHLARYVRTDRFGEESIRERQLEILGSKIRFAYETSSSTLLVTASQSCSLHAPFAENWIGEPLRILFGQLIYPRLVARNLGDGRAVVAIRRLPSIVREAKWVALWGLNEEATRDDDAFWVSYASLLAMIARERRFEANTITRLYEECIQAARATRWVWALTFASSIEALAKLLRPDGVRPKGEISFGTVTAMAADLAKHIQAWSGDSDLKKKAIRVLQRRPKGTGVVLRELKDAGVVTPDQLLAWQDIRHEVMHGGLVSPYSTKDEDVKLLLLAEMMHGMTRELIRRQSIVADPASTAAYT